MSELINTNDNRATIRWKLLTGASILALSAYVTSAALAKADDTDRPALWIDLGGQMEQVQGVAGTFTAPFMSITPTPSIYDGVSFTGSQRGARFSFGEEARITFQPKDSDWNFSAGIRYGRSHASQHTHRQIFPTSSIKWVLYYYGAPYGTYNASFPAAALADAQTQNSERHIILDFTAGKDVGLGMFGHQSSSTINAGVRIASFRANSSAHLSARPEINIHYYNFSRYSGILQANIPYGTFHQYTMVAQASRSFKGIGPSLSWNASAALAGNPQDGELELDWGINAALLFGKQKAKTSHTTHSYNDVDGVFVIRGGYYSPGYSNHPSPSIRSRSVTVPNVGGYAGLSLKWTNAKISFGYRYDTFLSAMDTGIDAAKKSNVTFNGPYASISFGLGD